jgi:HK97 family phage portal protein
MAILDTLYKAVKGYKPPPEVVNTGDVLPIGTGARRVSNATYGQDIYEAFGVTPSASGLNVNPISAMRVAAVYACVNKIAGAIATLPLHIYKTDGDLKERLPKDELWYQLNEQPAPQFTAASHWEGVSTAQLLRGDGYTWIRRTPAGNIKELLPLPAGQVYPMRQPDGSVRYYISLADYNITTWLEPSDVLHFHGFGFDGVKSMSVIRHAAKAAIGNALAMDEYSGKFFANGAHPSIILKTPHEMSPEQTETLRQAFADKYSGIQNAHARPLVLTEGLEAQEISLSADDAQLLEARQFQVVDIARAFGVPPHMIGETSASTSWGSGIESMSRGFVTYTLQPHLVRIEQELNRKLFPRNARRIIQFDRDALIEGDSAAQANYFRAALGGPGTGPAWLAVDEVRKQKGLAPQGGKAAQLFDPREGTQDAQTTATN